MRRIAAALVAIAGAAALALPALAKKQNPAAVALFKKAIAASDIEAKGSPAYRLQSTVRVFGANKQYTDGMLVKFWAPDGNWREETILRDPSLSWFPMAGAFGRRKISITCLTTPTSRGRRWHSTGGFGGSSMAA